MSNSTSNTLANARASDYPLPHDCNEVAMAAVDDGTNQNQELKDGLSVSTNKRRRQQAETTPFHGRAVPMEQNQQSYNSTAITSNRNSIVIPNSDHKESFERSLQAWQKMSALTFHIGKFVIQQQISGARRRQRASRTTNRTKAISGPNATRTSPRSLGSSADANEEPPTKRGKRMNAEEESFIPSSENAVSIGVASKTTNPNVIDHNLLNVGLHASQQPAHDDHITTIYHTTITLAKLKSLQLRFERSMRSFIDEVNKNENEPTASWKMVPNE